jgi:hypothetical protein
MNITDYLQRIRSDVDAAIATLQPPPPATLPPPVSDGVTVKAGGNLQAALDDGGTVNAEDGATFTGAFVLRKAGTRLVGPNASIVGVAGAPALDIPPGTRDVQAVLKSAITPWDDAVIRVGTSDKSQSRVEDVPTQIALSIQVPRHRGKRAFYINGADVVLLNCSARDVYDPAGRDSQGVLIFNTPGRIRVTGGVFEAGSECLLVGGDVTAIPGVVPTDLVFEDLKLTRPLAWKTDGVKRKVKALYELKAGINTILRRTTLSGCWVEGQVGFGIVLTPRNGQEIRNALIEDVTVDQVGGVLNLLGYDDGAYSPQLRDLVLRRVTGTAHAGDGWGPGRFLQWQAAPANITVEDCNADVDATAVYVNPGRTWPNATTPVDDGVTRGVKFLRNTISLRPYGIMLNGYTFAARWRETFPDGVISGNIFTNAGDGRSAYAANLPPDNTVNA